MMKAEWLVKHPAQEPPCRWAMSAGEDGRVTSQVKLYRLIPEGHWTSGFGRKDIEELFDGIDFMTAAPTFWYNSVLWDEYDRQQMASQIARASAALQVVPDGAC